MSKLEQFYTNKSWLQLNSDNQNFLQKMAPQYNFSFQDIKQLIDIAIDLQSWNEETLNELWIIDPKEKRVGKDLKNYLISNIKNYWNELREKPTDYSGFHPFSDFKSDDLKFINIKEERTILGDCPVASEKTRCCNLKTLDSVINCGFDCSYCTIQSFYKGGKILFERHLKEKLDKLNLDPNKFYHIGTGQSSDSLMWGNRENNLKHLINFAQNNPNIILELKTKSDNISYLMEHDIPKNVIVTWSINTPTIIENEEFQTATLDKRLKAAKLIQQKGILVGFHFHPMVYYTGWEEDYRTIAEQIMENFDPKGVALISIGTLTFIKPVIKKIRERNFRTKILQMPLIDTEGKYSYPYETKKQLFKHLYNSFKEWHNKVYFYMCMENKKLWMEVFEKEYNSNSEFEEDMITHYRAKMELL